MMSKYKKFTNNELAELYFETLEEQGINYLEYQRELQNHTITYVKEEHLLTRDEMIKYLIDHKK